MRRGSLKCQCSMTGTPKARQESLPPTGWPDNLQSPWVATGAFKVPLRRHPIPLPQSLQALCVPPWWPSFSNYINELRALSAPWTRSGVRFWDSPLRERTPGRDFRLPFCCPTLYLKQLNSPYWVVVDPMRNIRLTLAYDGTDFHGWQRQPAAPTVQGCLEDAIQKLTGTPAPVCGSGRTDAGVHALHQVANFHTASSIPCPNLVSALNDLLPPSVRVKAAEEAESTFHARYAARSKTYRYRILQTPVGSPFLGRFAYYHPYPLDRERMAQAARLLEGEHDFTSFTARDGQNDEDTKSMVRVIFRSRLLWRPRTHLLVYQVTANGFLHHMVRNIVGTLLEVGKGKLAPPDVLRILAARDRTQAGPTAPAQGLCLMQVDYA
jgi:tRNA pseudouridine38-40 synthase